MKVLLSGASGFVGAALQKHLKSCGHQVVRLVRDPKSLADDTIFWDPEHGKADAADLEGFDAIINLSGENIAGSRWNDKQKTQILESRVKSTFTLAKILAKLKRPPEVFICASAVGIYGNRGNQLCNEDTPSGNGFLAEVCRKWEAAAAPAKDKGIRTVHLRFGIVLSKKGGALAKMLPPFKLGLGGRFGDGKQYMSWITIEDLVAIVLFAMTQRRLQGPVNTVTPHPVTNEQFTKSLGKAIKRPAFFNVPAFMLKAIFGKEMAEEMFLNSTRVEPLRLNEAGYSFLYPELNTALQHLTE